MPEINLGNVKGNKGEGLKEILFKESTESGNVYRFVMTDNTEFEVTMPQGPRGVQGEKGDKNTLTIGSVIEGEDAGATITGESPNQILNLILPRARTGGADLLDFMYNYKGKYNESKETEYKIGDIVAVSGHEPCIVFETINPEAIHNSSLMQSYTKAYEIEDTVLYRRIKEEQETKIKWEAILLKEIHLERIGPLPKVSLLSYDEDSKNNIYTLKNDLDNYYPYSEIERVILNADGTIKYKLNKNDSTKKESGETAVLDGSDGDLMVKIPKFYASITFTEKGTRYRIFSYKNPKKKLLPDAQLHMAFKKSKILGVPTYDERDEVYIATTLSLLNNGTSKLFSAFKEATYRAFMPKIESKGENWTSLDFRGLSLYQLLYIVEFGTTDAINMTGRGIGSYADISNYAFGISKSNGNYTAIDIAKGVCLSYRGIEAPYGFGNVMLYKSFYANSGNIIAKIDQYPNEKSTRGVNVRLETVNMTSPMILREFGKTKLTEYNYKLGNNFIFAPTTSIIPTSLNLNEGMNCYFQIRKWRDSDDSLYLSDCKHISENTKALGAGLFSYFDFTLEDKSIPKHSRLMYIK